VRLKQSYQEQSVMRLKSLILPRRAAGLFLCALLIFNLAAAAEGQSGRRVPKRPTAPDPLPPAQSEPPIQPPDQQSSSQNEKARIPVLVVKYLPNISSSNIAGSIVVEGFLERMQRAATVKVRTGKDMNRKEASDYAKSSQDNYVVLLQLESDSANAGRGWEDPNDLYVDYVVFTPGTGKVKTSGHVYQRTRGVIQTPLPRTTSGLEYALRRAGAETADRVLNSLGQVGPPIHN
jgi:hypothetical protein